MAERGVSIGRDAYGNAIVTGDNNLTFVFFGLEAVPAEVLEALRAGRRLADVPGAVPLPALVLAIELADDGLSWQVSARRATGDPLVRHGASPWVEPGFAPLLAVFAGLGRVPAETAADAGRLQAAAQRLGEVLAGALSADEVAFLVAAGRGDPPPPLVVIESGDERVLALPWELLRLEARFVVSEGRLDVARSLPVAAAPVLSPPGAAFSLLVNVSAPEGSGLDSERESYAIVRALHEHVGVVINEMGEVEDLVAGLRREPPPVGVHFSGHGGRGTLLFEDEYGEGRVVAVTELLTEIRRYGPERLPRFFFLACCHGGDAPEGEDGLAAAATALHADGVAQVVAYFGPVLDEASTRAERAFYAELARGRLTRDAVRAARLELGKVQAVSGRQGLRDAGAAGHAGQLAYGWAQMVLYQRGPDYPLGTPIDAPFSVAVETTERRKLAAYPGSRSQVLKAGFVGRRKEMHELRRDLRGGRYLHVVQGIGGLGKSAFCNEALKLYARLGWKPVALWCADVEGAAEPVAGLLQQFEAAGRQLVEDGVWDRLLAQLEQWAARDVALQSPSARLLSLLRVLLDGDGPPLVVYLDNLESLQRGPESGAADDYAAWREAGAAALWQGLRDLVAGSPGRLAVLASGRYRHPDFVGRVMPFRGLPRDALWRLLRWFPSLRLLSETGRKGLVDRLAGHPRAVEFLEALIADAIARWEDEHDRFEPGRLSAEDEQAQIIAAALPQLTAKLSEDLLFAALWERVLDAGARDLLVRASVLRRPGSRALLLVLAGAAGEAAFTRLRASGLLTEIREPKPQGGWTLDYEVHPLVAELAVGRSPRSAELCQQAHRLAGTHLEQVAQTSPSWQGNIEAGYHLRQVGEVDRSYDLLAPLVQWLLNRGRMLEARAVLAEIGDPDLLQPSRAAWVQTFAGDVAVATGDLATARTAYGAGLAIREKLAEADPSNATWQRDLSVSHEKLGNVLVAQGQLGQALEAYGAGLAIRETLAEADPSNATWQRDLSVSHDKLGDVLVAQGQLGQALEAYGAGLAIRETLAEADPSNSGWQRDLSVSHERLGNVLVAQGQLGQALEAYGTGLAIAETLAEADPSNASWQRDLSVSHNKLGDVLVAQGQLGQALEAYGAGLAIAETLAEADPSNASWQRDLSVSHNKLGDVLVAQGQLGQALEAYGAGLAIAETLAEADPSNATWQRDLFVSFAKLGDVLVAQGQLGQALEAYGAGLAIAEKLAEADPSNSGWQRDLSVSHNKLGDVLVAQGQLGQALEAYGAGLAIAEKLAEADPSNAEWQRDLSVSHNKLGDVLVAQGQLGQALEAYGAGLAIREKLAEADPSNATWQRDLFVSFAKLGDVLVAQGQLGQALEAYGAGLAIAEKLAEADPSNATWQRDLFVSFVKLGSVLEQSGDLAAAAERYEWARQISVRLNEHDPSNATWRTDRAWIEARLASLKGGHSQSG